VTPLGLRQFTADPVQRPFVVGRPDFTAPVTKVAEGAQGLLGGLGRRWVIIRQPPHLPRVEQDTGRAMAVVVTAVDARGLL
jgi:hypothetical protein